MHFKIPYGKQTIDKSDISYVSKIFKSDFLTTGPQVEKFENLFKNKVKVKYAVSCSSGTSALHLSLLSLEIKKNDTVIMPTINFIAAANMTKLLKAKIYLADVDPDTGQITKETIEDCIKQNKIKNLKLIFIQHHGGFPNYGKELLYIKRKYRCSIIEDACHALGGKYSIKKNQIVGCCKYSDLSTFSFHPVKSITTAEGGMITTNSKKLSEKIKLFRNHGILKKKIKNSNLFLGYSIVNLGFNYRLSDINAALGFCQLKKLDKFIKKRNQISIKFKKDLEVLKDIIKLPVQKKDIKNAWHLYILRINFDKLKINRQKLFVLLNKKGIITQVHYPPIYSHPVYKDLKKNFFTGTTKYYNSCLSIPIYPSLNIKEIRHITSSIKQIIDKYKK
jgi:dTDP-4-amino-4,6-dideoxygalactose transaminase